CGWRRHGGNGGRQLARVVLAGSAYVQWLGAAHARCRCRRIRAAAGARPPRRRRRAPNGEEVMSDTIVPDARSKHLEERIALAARAGLRAARSAGDMLAACYLVATGAAARGS